MSNSRSVLILGMHRSGTSATTRGLASLGVYLGDQLIEPRTDNIKGYWEDRYINDLNERLLGALSLSWDDPRYIYSCDFAKPEIESFKPEALSYLNHSLAKNSLWGFKDPRTIRLLPFWKNVLDEMSVRHAYVIVIRNPVNVVNSLLERNGIGSTKANRLWLVHNVPFIHEISKSSFVVVDYDLLLDDPLKQLFRIARALKIPIDSMDELNDYADNFLDLNLRHHSSELRSNIISSGDRNHLETMAQEAYLWLRELALDRLKTDSNLFWSTWYKIQNSPQTINLCCPSI